MVSKRYVETACIEMCDSSFLERVLRDQKEAVVEISISIDQKMSVLYRKISAFYSVILSDFSAYATIVNDGIHHSLYSLDLS